MAPWLGVVATGAALGALLAGCASTSTPHDDPSAPPAHGSAQAGAMTDGGADSGAGGASGSRASPAAGAGAPNKDSGAAATPGMDSTAGTNATDAGATPGPTASSEPRIPQITDECPTLETGNVTVKGQQVQLWVGEQHPDKQGAVMFYWHATGNDSGEAVDGLDATIEAITAEGGVVASFGTTTETGTNTGNFWYTGDFEMADVILACAALQLNIDPRRVYTAGCAGGGLQAGAMVYARSSYLAAAMPNAGGVIATAALEDPNHVPSVITAHGAQNDLLIIDFEDTSAMLYNDIAARGGYAVSCNHGGGFCTTPPELQAAAWQFLNDHPFGVDADPYAGALPASFPTYCRIIE